MRDFIFARIPYGEADSFTLFNFLNSQSNMYDLTNKTTNLLFSLVIIEIVISDLLFYLSSQIILQFRFAKI